MLKGRSLAPRVTGLSYAVIWVPTVNPGFPNNPLKSPPAGGWRAIRGRVGRVAPVRATKRRGRAVPYRFFFAVVLPDLAGVVEPFSLRSTSAFRSAPGPVPSALRMRSIGLSPLILASPRTTHS